MHTGEYLRNLTWIGSLVPAKVDRHSMGQDEVLAYLDQFVPPSRKHWDAPAGRRSRYFYRVLRGEFSPQMNKVKAGECVAPGSTAWFHDCFWHLLDPEPMDPSYLATALTRLPCWMRLDLPICHDVIPVLSLDAARLSTHCETLEELESWNGFKCLFLLMRIAQSHQDWARFDLMRPSLIMSLLGCVDHPVLRFSIRFLSLHVLTWMSTRGRCGLSDLPSRLWFLDEFFISLFAYAQPGVSDWRPFVYAGTPILNPLSGLIPVPDHVRVNVVRFTVHQREAEALMRRIFATRCSIA